MIRFFKILDKFVLDGGQGIVLMGSPFPGMENGRLAAKTPVEVRSPEGTVLVARPADFELGRSDWSPNLPRLMMIRLWGKDFDLPPESEVWVEEDRVRFPSM